ncbi:MAG: DNA mismatch repair endonuclease MutL [Saccharofermentans sp.]|nr:DNA mismatch repair endonuclease MutL [Saccharofermentans sp.]
MGRINVLDKQTANAIKAGEVIERPVSVVKELVDNSIDAGATTIKVEFESGGISLIRVTDNGIGMDREDAEKSFLIHATSKITKIEDIYDLSTQGFRGEALASISACADVTMVTKQADSDIGTIIKYEAGELVKCCETVSDTGTVITVTSLFANIPARYKFLKKDSTEGMYICSLVEKLAVINPHISFKLYKDGKQVLSTPGNGEMLDTIYSVYGKQVATGLVPVNYEYEGIKLRGYTGKTDLVHGNRSMQYIYVNERCIKSASITAAIDEAYRNSVMKNRFPVCFLCIYVPAGGVDVNVHPQKAEVKFSNDSDVFRLVYHGIKNAIFETSEAKSQFSGISSGESSEPASSTTVVPESKKLRPAGTQLSYDLTSRSGSSVSSGTIDTPTVSQTKAATDLLQILSEFKPDINMIKNDEPSEPAPVEMPVNPMSPVSELAEGPESPAEEPVEEPAEQFIPRSQDPDSDIYEILHSKFIGFLFTTYIIMQSGDNVFFIDQHAAHERVLYERFMKRRSTQDEEASNVQTLLVPQIVSLSTADFSFVSDNIENFQKAGFDIDIMGSRQIALRSIPIADSHATRLKNMSKPSVIFENILSDMKREVPAKNNIWYSLIQTTACKAAIKAHDVITEEEAMSLIEQLSVLDDPYHCAHGRPVFIKVSQTEFEKNFKRIV